MAAVTIRELRNHGGDVVARVERGERLTITRDGHAVAEIAPLRRAPRSLDDLIERRQHLPAVDPDALRADIDSLIDASL